MSGFLGQGHTSGSVAWDFDHVGFIEAQPAEGSSGLDAESAAIEAGAQDVQAGEEPGTSLFITEPADLDTVSRALPEQGYTVLSAKLGYQPKNPVSASSLSAEALAEVEAFLAALDEHDDVQELYVAFAS
jgi:transcriptional/translational regulatory protein YebC/TACO1